MDLTPVLPVLAIGAGLFVILRGERASIAARSQRQEKIDPRGVLSTPPPRPLNDLMMTPDWGAKRLRPYKSVPAPGLQRDYLFLDNVTGQTRMAKQNAGFEAF